MVVKNKKTNIEYELTHELWQKIVDRGLRNAYVIIDGEDKTVPKIKLPKEIEEFKAEKLRINIDSEPKKKKSKNE